ncbi:polyisoprenoid-binding protein [Sphingobacteriaceae bacterium WQ 2009]|uniref:Polyisoprenoid-binding protein n=1 Tax=Rhinopithecimicrobium faecis TaxID=2820698 RepID=A0A8T4HBH6_9SPHI|nr:polyisoprenoid-binding protein [Sphingobacteriaceae bacterium WQ 2009]
MNRFISFLFAAVLSLNFAYAQTTWTADPAHTNARFSINHLGISFVDGEFTKVSGDVIAPSATDFSAAKVNFTIDVNSINTRIEARDGHLKSDDFFNAEKFPTMSLKSVSFKKIKGNKYLLIADLTIRDHSKQVTFAVTQNGGIITDPWGGTRAGFTATAKINRQDFGLKYNDKLPSGIEAVASEVEITINTELVKK